ncbi:swi3-domain-containing protein [Phaffia rhodozyma]|uniref:Chromosome segregation in meiosis protein n=1 Tax=Phaffia rhodozyma TaxID=264483 RepID=A0A0F7SUE6_PHARH|nr:swi3-domain-containing protein [Phaffia rhodozyma]
MSLANLFDSPSPPRPVRPQGGTPLFLQSPTPSVASPPARAKRSLSSTKANIQKDLALRLFDDDEDEDDIERLAGPTVIPGSENLRVGERSDDELEIGEDEKSTNKRRAPLKVNIQRLQEPIGLRRLAELSKNRAKIKGKGHERSDLNNLMNDYRIWTHQLFPKTDFSGTVRDIENLCHTRMSKRILDDLQASLLDEPALSGVISSELESDLSSAQASNLQSMHAQSLLPSLSRSETTIRFGNNADGEVDDMDAMIAAAEAESRPTRSVSPSTQRLSPAFTLELSNGKQPLFNGPDDDDAEEDWSILDEIEQSRAPYTGIAIKKSTQQTLGRNRQSEQGVEEEEADWAMFDEAHGS